MFGFVKDQLIFEVLKYSVKSNIKLGYKSLKKKYNKSKVSKAVDSSIDKCKESEVGGFIGKVGDVLNKRYNEVNYYIRNGGVIEFKDVELTYGDAMDLISTGIFTFSDGLEIRIMDEDEYFTSKVYYLRRSSILFLMEEHFYSNEYIRISLVK